MVWQKILNMSRGKNSSHDRDEYILIGAAALMIQVAAEHDGVSDVENHAIIGLLKEFSGGVDERALEIFQKAKHMQEQATDLYCLTRGIMKHTQHEDQLKIVRLLYKIGYSDGHLDHYEDQIITRIAGLLGVDTRDRVHIKNQEKEWFR